MIIIFTGNKKNIDNLNNKCKNHVSRLNFRKRRSQVSVVNKCVQNLEKVKSVKTQKPTLNVGVILNSLASQSF